MKLEKYLHKMDIRVAEFAKLIGVHRNLVYCYIRGTVIPSTETLRLIAEVTDFLVTPNDFILKEGN